MGYITTGQGTWGDAPQDVVDVWFSDQGFNPEKPGEKTIREILLGEALQSESLRKSVDAIFDEDYERSATDWEYRNLLLISLQLGGTTGFFEKLKGRRRMSRYEFHWHLKLPRWKLRHFNPSEHLNHYHQELCKKYVGVLSLGFLEIRKRRRP